MKHHLLAALLLTPLCLQAEKPEPPSSFRTAFLADSSRDSYVAVMKQRMAINHRDRDPFGLLQEVRPGPPTLPGPQPVHDPLDQVVPLLSVTVMSDDASAIMIGSRWIREGQPLSVSYQNKVFEIEVLKITPEAVHFRNPETGSTATKPFRRPEDALESPGMPLDLPEGIRPESSERTNPLPIPL